VVGFLRAGVVDAFAALTAALVVVGQAAAASADYPNRPIRLVVPFPAGSNIDGNARQLAPKLSETIGQQIVIDNRGGAAGTIGAGIVARAAADGYTILMGNAPTHGLAPSIFKELAYDPVRDFTPIGRIATATYVLAISAGLPARSVSELVAYARARAGQLNYGSTGNGTGVHLAGVLFNTRAGVDIRHIPYNSVPQIFVDLTSGALALMFYPYQPLIPLHQTGKVRLLATTGVKRAAYLPELPTAIEAGLADFVFFAWHGFYGPAGMNPAHARVFYQSLLKAVADPKVAANLLVTGVEVDPLPSAEFAAFTRMEIERYRQLVQIAGVKSQ
jgi:tripartite-type tricarboxylate transporter receptor subunit TctC